MIKIIRTKIYSVSNPCGTKIYIAEHNNQIFYGSVLYFNKTNHLDDPGFDVNVQLESFIDIKEEMVYQRCIEWINKNFSKTHEIKLVDTRYPQK
jgi:hypothetical protein